MGKFTDLYQRFPQVERLAPAIRRHYVPLTHFGDIEVWRRKPEESESRPRPAT
jgi:hypothetical protein